MGQVWGGGQLFVRCLSAYLLLWLQNAEVSGCVLGVESRYWNLWNCEEPGVPTSQYLCPTSCDRVNGWGRRGDG